MTEQLHLTEDELVLHYYGEDVAQADAHLRSCTACQAKLARLQRVMAFIDSAPAVDAPAGFERVTWARLEPALHQRRRGWLAWFVFSPSRLAFAAGVLLLVGAAFVAGRIAERSTTPATPVVAQTAAQVRERILLVDLGEHLDRTQRMLVELASAPSAEDAAGPIDMTLEQSRAEQLVAANRLYRQAAASTGDAAIASVLDDLERVLVDLAASPKEMTQEELDAVRRRIESKELLFKVRVMASQVRARQQQAMPVRHTQFAVGS
jgi:hypothetical protein